MTMVSSKFKVTGALILVGSITFVIGLSKYGGEAKAVKGLEILNVRRLGKQRFI